jgi:hypothetical protein
VNQAKHVPLRAVQTNSRVNIQADWHLAGSLEGFALCDGQYLGYIVDIICAAWTKVDRSRAKVTSLLRRRRQMLKPLPKRQVDELLELQTAALVESLERGSDIIIEGYCSSHASTHSIFDALMQLDQVLSDHSCGLKSPRVIHLSGSGTENIQAAQPSNL